MDTPSKSESMEVAEGTSSMDTSPFPKDANKIIVRTAANGRNVTIRGCSQTLMEKLNQGTSISRRET